MKAGTAVLLLLLLPTAAAAADGGGQEFSFVAAILQMIAALGHNVEYYDSRRLDTLVSRLRIKINRGGSNLPVRSIHSVGYAFVAPIVLED